MNDVALAIEEARKEIAAAAEEFLPDLCDIDGPLFVDGGSAGDSVELVSFATKVPVGYESRGNGKQIVVGGEAYTATHQLRMPRTPKTVLITPQHKITLRPRGMTGSLVFEKPVISEDDEDALLIIDAVCVVQGYQ